MVPPPLWISAIEVYRRALRRASSRVLDRAARLGNWGTSLPKGRGRGVAIAYPFGTMLAQVIEVAVDGPDVRVLRVVSVVDCGAVLDPGIATANIEAGIVFGLSYCKSEITFEQGAVVQGKRQGDDRTRTSTWFSAGQMTGELLVCAAAPVIRLRTMRPAAYRANRAGGSSPVRWVGRDSGTQRSVALSRIPGAMVDET